MTIEQMAREMQQRLGGKIFVFPIRDGDPFSHYAIAIDVGAGQFKMYEDSFSINEAAACLLTLIDSLKSEGFEVEYERDVRFVSYGAQMNAPDVTMRRIRNTPGAFKPSSQLMEKGADVRPNPEDPEGVLLSARGILKFCLLEMMDKNPKGALFMGEYFKLLASRRYGKTAAAIKQEVRRMSKHEAVQWAERTYTRYISNDRDIMDIFQRLRGAEV
ncbi:hypothetical protein H7B90_13070 [Cohnella xylanilytica]|uniref:Uncharacterized protein n=1 Tax=Cohnella xylanilytica TaxID=557555 RepID=A0A841TVM9_9BACL|nr:hypothetical protein [Cohnella xylanilytica]MBB6692336.1 hypothetical protein [Cohnella xylanilytica]